jgi:hypothetical protein
MGKAIIIALLILLLLPFAADVFFGVLGGVAGIFGAIMGVVGAIFGTVIGLFAGAIGLVAGLFGAAIGIAVAMAPVLAILLVVWGIIALLKVV